MNNDYYSSSLRNNEIDANRQMVNMAVVAAVFLAIFFVLYIFNVFPIQTLNLIYIFFPLNIILLLSTAIWARGEKLYKPGYKYFLLYSFLSVISILNIVVPKHAILGWAVVIVLSNHFYSQKVCRIMFISTLIAMLLCMYGAMFFGEYDNNLLTSSVIFDETKGAYVPYEPLYPQERYEFLHKLLLEGDNRYLKVFGYYYIPRAIFVTLVYLISNGLNVRGFKLFNKEVESRQHEERISTELNIAKEIQLSALPKEFQSNKDVTILAEIDTAREVGGDFYDYYKLDDTHVAIVIGDVSGKGTPAAMFMMKTVTLFKIFTKAGRLPSDILKDVNKALFDGNDNQMFVTCFLGILDTKTGKFTYSNAGHNKPIIGSFKNYRYLECSSGFILGALEETYVVDEEATLKRGDSITLYTDGITEAKNKNSILYGEERLLKFYNSKEFSSIVELEYELKDDIKKFAGEEEQADDMTYLILEYQEDSVVYDELLTDSKIDSLKDVFDFSSKFLSKVGLSNFDNQISIVIDELFSNISKYAYDKDGLFYIRMSHNKKKNTLNIVLVDKGKEFNPLENNELKVDEKELEEGGLGLLIVKEFATSISYNRINDKNILVIEKKL